MNLPEVDGQYAALAYSVGWFWQEVNRFISEDPHGAPKQDIYFKAILKNRKNFTYVSLVYIYQYGNCLTGGLTPSLAKTYCEGHRKNNVIPYSVSAISGGLKERLLPRAFNIVCVPFLPWSTKFILCFLSFRTSHLFPFFNTPVDDDVERRCSGGPGDCWAGNLSFLHRVSLFPLRDHHDRLNLEHTHPSRATRAPTASILLQC